MKDMAERGDDHPDVVDHLEMIERHGWLWSYHMDLDQVAAEPIRDRFLYKDDDGILRWR